MSKSLKKLIDINRLREFKNKLVGAGSAYVQTSAVDQTIAGTKTFSQPIVGSVTGSSGSCTGNAATATTATSVPWSGVTGKPSSYTPAAHTQAASTITGLAKVATSGSYTDLSNKPTIPVIDSALSATSTNGLQNKVIKTALDRKANSSHTHTKSQITDFPALATVATSGSYTDLANKPAIPTVNNATLTIQKNGTTVKTFTANASANVTANITVPTKVSELTNDSGYITGVSWNSVSGKPSTFTPSSHTHDDRYYTEAEVNNRLKGKANDNAVVHKSGNESIAGTKTFNDNVHANGFHSTATNAFMAQHGSYTFLIRNDSNDTYLLMSDKDGVPGTWSNARPLVIHNSTGVCNINGNAATATTATKATSADKATNATNSNAANQLQAFVNDDFTGGNHYVKAIRSSQGWSTHLWMCYNNGAKMADEVSVNYANSAGSANTANSATKATQDSDGNRISATYVKKTDAQNFNTGASFIGFYSLVSQIKGVGNGGSLTIGSTTSASNIYDTIIANQDTVTLSRNITLAGSWKLVSIIKKAGIEQNSIEKNYIGVTATHSPGSSYAAGVIATQGLFVRVS